LWYNRETRPQKYLPKYFTKQNNLHTFNVLSHDPVMIQVYDVDSNQWQVLTGASWAAICVVWFVTISQHFTSLLQDATKTFVPSPLQQTSKIGMVIDCKDFGTVWLFSWTSQQRTYDQRWKSNNLNLLHHSTFIYVRLTVLSQLPAMRNVFCDVAGLNSIAETVSSGGNTTSKSLLGFVGSAIVNTPQAVKPPYSINPFTMKQ